MSQIYPAFCGRDISQKQRSKLPQPIGSMISRWYLVEFFACALLTTSQSVSGSLEFAGNSRYETTTASRAPEFSSIEKICTPSCVTLMEYQSDSTHLEFSRTFNTSQRVQDERPDRWRHRYEIHLTRQGDNRIVIDHHGIRHLFKLEHDGTYSPANSISGSLRFEQGQHIWVDSHEIEHGFQGSFLTTLRFPDNQTLTLHYKSGQLHSVTDEKSVKIKFIHEHGYLSEARLPDGRVLRYTSDPCDSQPQPITDLIPDDSTIPGSDEREPTTEAPPDRCDTQNNPVPGFDAIAVQSNVTTLDARPASCQSYFVEFYGTVRGEQIEAGLEDHSPYAAMVPTNRSFPIIDFINGNELLVVRSRDVASPTYNNPDLPDALYNRLMRDGQQIQTRALDRLESEGVLSSTENGRTTLITYGEQQSVALHLLIRQDMASATHWQQIDNARTELAARYGIHLQVIIIP